MVLAVFIQDWMSLQLALMTMPSMALALHIMLAVPEVLVTNLHIAHRSDHHSSAM